MTHIFAADDCICDASNLVNFAPCSDIWRNWVLTACPCFIWQFSFAMEEALDQANAIWSSILSEDQMKALGLGSEGNRQAKRPKTENKELGKKGPRHSKPSYDELVTMVARLALRTEDSLQQLLQEHQFILHLQPGQGSVIPLMSAATQSWHKGSKETPLRHHLVVVLISTLEERLTNLSRSNPKDPQWIDCQKLNLIDSDGNMPYLRWDATARTLKPTKDATLRLDEALRAIQNIHRLVQDPTTTIRFHGLTKPSESTDRAIPFLWMISSRNQPEAWSEVRRVCYHAIWQLVRTSIRPQGTERSNLSKGIQQKLTKG
jgi:hypothetical protein